MNEYIKEKVTVLHDFGLTNKKEVAAYLEEHSDDTASERSFQTQVDNAARTLLNAYFAGDRTLCKVNENKPINLYQKLKEEYPDYKVLRRSEITAVVGSEGFTSLRSCKYIKRIGTIGTEQVFAYNK